MNHRPPVGTNRRARPWKYDVVILPSTSDYRVAVPQSRDALYCESTGRLWLAVTLSFPDELNKRSDYYNPRSVGKTILSEDGGLTWEFTDQPFPGPREHRSILSDGSIVETGSHGWERHPRSEVEVLKSKGYFVVDQGEEESYCAIIYDMWTRRSTDGGKTWTVKPVHPQFPFFAYFVNRRYQRVLNDGTLVAFCYGRSKADDPRNAYLARSTDGGDTWGLVMVADGRFSPVPQGFSETFPIVYPDGRMFVLIRSWLGTTAYLVRSHDGGRTWSEPVETPIRSKHPVPTLLADGTIVVTYPRRFARPFGVRARFTPDMGRTWSEEVVLRDEFEVSDGIAFPITAELPDGTLFTVLRGNKRVDEDAMGYFIFGSRWTRDYRRPSAPEVPVPPRLTTYNAELARSSPWAECPGPLQPR